MKFGKIALVGLVLLWVASVRSETSQLQGVVDSINVDTSNCLNLYKPFPVVLVPGAESLITKEYLQQYSDFMDSKIIDEIYRRVRDAVCEVLVRAGLPCLINTDTLMPCVRDSLNLIYKAVLIKDTSHDDIGSAILIYEDIKDSSTTDGVIGPEYAGFMVNRDVNTSESEDGATGDTNGIKQSYLLVMPSRTPMFSNDRGPGDIGYSLGTIRGNSELVSDTTGNLYWMDRDWFERAMIDTIICDTNDPSGGQLDVLADVINFRGDTTRSQSGKWQGLGGVGGPISLDWFERIQRPGVDATPNKRLELRPNEQMLASWDIQFPDTGNEFTPAFWRWTRGLQLAPKWTPFDDQYVVWGTDTVRGTGSQFTEQIKISKGAQLVARTPIVGQSMPYESFRAYYAEVEWVVVDADSAAAGDFWVWENDYTPDGIHGRPAPSDARLNDLYVVSNFAPDFSFQGNNSEAGDPYYQSDSTFLVNIPAVGSDTVMVIRWKVTGFISKYQGEG